ncbi:MAG TPA: hypothetical protein DCZ95_10440 [Verrucomicrobia bacterium]|nr:MAG: hypothetical protein A2X46_18700 [Lentisphaerae bacterium GWF2_57_35]HBA84500.1 hypothetical protein [Verrucomicrobiota bacterium]
MDFVCQQCGTCCRWSGHVLLTASDIAAISTHLGLSENDFIDRYAALASNRSQLTLQDAPDGACIFLDAQQCRIYPVRPSQCRTFPSQWQVEGCPASFQDKQRSRT